MKVQACACNCVCLYYVLYCRLSFLMFLAEMHACKISPDHRNVWVMSSCSFCFSSLFPSGQIPRCTHGLAGGEWCSVCIWSIWEHRPLRRSFKHDAKVGEVAWPGSASALTLCGSVFMGDLFLNPHHPFFSPSFVCHISCPLSLVIKMKRDSRTVKMLFNDFIITFYVWPVKLYIQSGK